MLSVQRLKTPELAKSGVYEFPPQDTHIREGSTPHGRAANVVEVVCKPARPVVVVVQFAADWAAEVPTWAVLDSVRVPAGQRVRQSFNVAGHRWVRLVVCNGNTAQGPVSLTATWHEG